MDEIKEHDEVKVPMKDIHRLKHDWSNALTRITHILAEYGNAIDALIEDMKVDKKE